jgi:hypothetical protein
MGLAIGEVTVVAEWLPVLRVRGDAAVLPDHLESASAPGVDIVETVASVTVAVATAGRLLACAVPVVAHFTVG